MGAQVKPTGTNDVTQDSAFPDTIHSKEGSNKFLSCEVGGIMSN